VTGTVVAVDAVGIRGGGGAVVALGIVEALLAETRIAGMTVFTSPRDARDFEWPASRRLFVVESAAADGAAGRALWHMGGLARAVTAHGAGLMLALAGGGVPPSEVPGVTLMQQSLLFSEEALARCEPALVARMAALRVMAAASCRVCARVVVQTPAMVATVAAAFAVPPSRIWVVEPPPRLGPRDALPHAALAPLRKSRRGGRVLYVGHDAPYKNLDVLRAAWPEVRAARGEARLFVTLPADHPLAREPHVVALGHLEPGALREAYEEADVLVMPSLTETVGLPMLESMSVGCAVVAADRPYAHDVCAEGAAYFDPLDAADLAAKLGALLGDEAARGRLGQAGRALAASRAAARPYARLAGDLIALAAPGAKLPRDS